MCHVNRLKTRSANGRQLNRMLQKPKAVQNSSSHSRMVINEVLQGVTPAFVEIKISDVIAEVDGTLGRKSCVSCSNVRCSTNLLGAVHSSRLSQHSNHSMYST